MCYCDLYLSSLFLSSDRLPFVVVVVAFVVAVTSTVLPRCRVPHLPMHIAMMTARRGCALCTIQSRPATSDKVVYCISLAVFCHTTVPV